MSNYSKLLKRADLRNKFDIAGRVYKGSKGKADALDDIIPAPIAVDKGPAVVSAPVDLTERRRDQLRSYYEKIRNKELCNYMSTFAGVTGARLGMSSANPALAFIASKFGNKGKAFADRLNRTSKDRGWTDWFLQTGISGLGGLGGAWLGFNGAKWAGNKLGINKGIGPFWNDMTETATGNTIAKSFDNMFAGMSNDEIYERLHNMNNYLKHRYSPSNAVTSALAGGLVSAGIGSAFDAKWKPEERGWFSFLGRQALQTLGGMAAANGAATIRNRLLGLHVNPLPNQYYDPHNPEDNKLGKRVGRYLHNTVLSSVLPGWYITHKNYAPIPDNLPMPMELRGERGKEFTDEEKRQMALKRYDRLQAYKAVNRMNGNLDLRGLWRAITTMPGKAIRYPNYTAQAAQTMNLYK